MNSSIQDSTANKSDPSMSNTSNSTKTSNTQANNSTSLALKIALGIISPMMVVFLITSIILGFVLFDGSLTTIKSNATRNAILNYISQDYIGEKPTDKSKLEGELKGLVSSLNDPYSQYLTKDETNEFRNAINEEYEGIGVRFSDKSGLFVITQVMKDSPAQAAGIQADDILKKVNNEEITGQTLDEIVNKIKGPAGTTVSLTVRRGDEEVETVIKRAAIKTELVEVSYDKNLAIIRISSFGDDVYPKLKAVASEITSKSDVNGIVLDLRSNTGGILSAGINATSFFIKEGDVVTYEVGNEQNRIDTAIKAEPSLRSYPLAIVVDNYTASAAEIMAAGIRDNRGDDVIVVGETTYGKGVVQQLFSLPDGGTLKLTVAEWLTPKKEKINKQGIKPGIEIESEKALDKANEELRKKL